MGSHFRLYSLSLYTEEPLGNIHYHSKPFSVRGMSEHRVGISLPGLFPLCAVAMRDVLLKALSVHHLFLF